MRVPLLNFDEGPGILVPLLHHALRFNTQFLLITRNWVYINQFIKTCFL